MTSLPPLLYCYLFSAQPTMPPVLAEAASLHSSQLRIEMAGLIWIGAELVIFYLVLRLRFIVQTHSPDETVGAQSARKPLLRPLLGTLLVAAVLTVGRYGFIEALPDAIHAVILRNPADLRHQIHALYMARAHTHLALWCGFITLWVLLEMAIVYVGFKTYRGLRSIFESLPKGSES